MIILQEGNPWGDNSSGGISWGDHSTGGNSWGDNSTGGSAGVTILQVIQKESSVGRNQLKSMCKTFYLIKFYNILIQ